MVKKEEEQLLIELNTKRLRILCLTPELMEIAKDSIWSCEDKLGLVHSMSKDMGDELADDFYGAYTYHRTNFPDVNLIWYRLWIIIHSEDNRIIGGACFKGAPNRDGEVEIGYGIHGLYQTKGYATEAVQRLVEWAKQQEDVQFVTAETLKDNTASHRVLQKNGMVQYREDGENYFWRI